MTPKQWKALCAQVTDAMKAATRPFVTPLTHEASGEPTRIGSAAYVELTSDGVNLITCEHVARYQNQRHLPFGRKRPVPLTGTACTDRLPLDVASIRLNGQSWQDQSSKARALPWARFAQKHAPADDEILFFYGLAGENFYSGYGKFSNIMTGYCTQEKRNNGDDDIFEMFWEPENTSLSPQTSSKIKQDFKYDDAQGFSGSLVWNTRFVEKGSDINRWSPADALVTGLLRRWDPATRTLLVWRVEHLRKWLAARPSWA